MAEPPITEDGRFSRTGWMRLARSVMLGALLIAFGVAISQPIPAVACAVLAVAMPVVAMRRVRRQALERASQ